MSWEPASDGGPTPPALVAAQLATGRLNVDRMPWWAADLLANGHDGKALRELAGLNATDPRTIRDVLPEALAELGIDVPPSVLAAAMVVFDDLARRTLAGQLGERWTADAVAAFVTINTNYDSDVLELPLGSLYEISEMWDGEYGPLPDELKQLVRQACHAQLTRVEIAAPLAHSRPATFTAGRFPTLRRLEHWVSRRRASRP